MMPPPKAPIFPNEWTFNLRTNNDLTIEVFPGFACSFDFFSSFVNGKLGQRNDIQQNSWYNLAKKKREKFQ